MLKNITNKITFILLIISQGLLYSCSYSSETNPLLVSKKTPPGPIRILSTVHGTDRISIEWSSPEENDFSYVLITWMPGGAAGVRVSSGTNSYTITGLSSAVDYTIELTSVDNDGYKSSPVDVFKSRDTIRPGTITISSRSETNDYTGITFNWNPPADTDFNHVEVSWFNANGTAERRSVPKGTNYITISGLSKLIDYTFSFTSVDDAGNSSLTPATEIKYRDSTAPPTVTDVNLADYYTSIFLNWTNPSVVDFHHIRITWNSQSTVLAAGVNSFTISGTSSNADYNINIYSVDDAGNESAPPYNIQKTRDVTIPGTVTDISYDSTKLHKISINWKDPADADLKHILVTWTDENGIDSGSQIVAKSANSGRTNSFYKDNLDSSKTYSFLITAVDYAGNTADSSHVIKYKDTTPPGQIRNESQENHLHEITITWEDPAEPADPDESDFKRVKIIWITGGTLIGTDYINKGIKTFTRAGLDSAKDYTFRLYSVDDDGNESLPVEVLKNRDVTAPGPVTDVLAATPADGVSISITWTDPVDPADSRDRDFDHVKIAWVDETGTITGSSIKPKGACSFSITGLDGSKRYNFKLMSVDEDGNESAAVTVIKYRETVPPAQVILTGLTQSSTVISFTWTDPSDSDFDHIEISWVPAAGTTAGGSSSPAIIAAGVETETVNGLTNPYEDVNQGNKFIYPEYTFSIVTVDSAGNRSDPVTLKAVCDTSISSGTVFMIYNADDLNAVRGGIRTGWTSSSAYILMNDIDLSQPAPSGTIYTPWTPIAKTGNSWGGDFNGNGCSIKNMKISASSNFNGFFGVTVGVIRNVNIINCEITSSSSASYTGGLIGYLSMNSTTNPPVIRNCFVSGSISITSANSQQYIGGAIGTATIGTTTKKAEISQCGTNMDIIISLSGTASVTSLGGLAGYANNYFPISESYSMGNISVTGGKGGLNVGGLFGFSNTQFINCYSRSNVTAYTILGNIGGFAGTSHATTANCYATGDVSNAGGTLTTYAAFIAYGNSTGANSYYCGALNVPNAAYETRGTRKTAAEMQTQTPYSGWDFSAIWAIDPLINGGFPYLRNNPPR